MPGLADNPFAVLTAVAAPAVLTNACSVLALGTSNRLARVIDRTRFLVSQMRADKFDSSEYAVRMRMLERLRERGRLIILALRILYAALGGFAASALISVIGAGLAYYDLHSVFRVFAVLALVVGVFSVCALVFGCIMMVRETTLAMRNVSEEVDLAVASLKR